MFSKYRRFFCEIYYRTLFLGVSKKIHSCHIVIFYLEYKVITSHKSVCGVTESVRIIAQEFEIVENEVKLAVYEQMVLKCLRQLAKNNTLTKYVSTSQLGISRDQVQRH